MTTAIPSPVFSRSSTLPGADGALAAYEAAPAEPSGGIVVLHEAFGLTDHIADVVRRAAGEGYHAVAPDLFHRHGGGVAPYGDLQAAARNFAGLTDDGLLADVDAALTYLQAAGIPAERTAVIGFCFGGRVAFLAGARRSLGAAVTLYGGGIMTANPFLPFPALVDDVPTMRTPWLGLYGEQDHGIPADEVDALAAALALAPVATELVRYPEAGHAFHNDVLPSYHRESAVDAWERALAWLRAHGVR